MLPRFLFPTLLVWSFFGILHCQAQPLVLNEVDALKKIGEKLGKQWDFRVDPCSGNSGWVDPNSKKEVAINVTCGACNATSCHVTSIILKRQNLTGSLPQELASLTSLQFIDLSHNYLDGTIPVAWTSLPLVNLSLVGNRISGSIPEELGNITTLNILVLEDNLLQGSIPSSLGKLRNLEQLLLSGNNLTGELPKTLGNLKNLTYFRIDGNPISGKIPSFIVNWSKIKYLEMQGTILEGPFPPNFSTLETLSELRVTDWKGGDGKFPPLENMIGLTRLVLRNLSISGELPNYIPRMANLKTLDLSFNFLTGRIPESYISLENHISFIFLTNNNLTGAIPDWILNTRKQLIDISYNSFNGSNAPPDCHRGSNLNVVSSYSSTNDNKVTPCLRRNNPCPGVAKYYTLFINCGGPAWTIGEDEYQGDTDTEGPSYYISYNDKWAYSSTGSFDHNDNEPFLATNVSVLNMSNPELYMTARLSPLSLKYYGLCLQNGPYTVNLHFAEIMFNNNQTYFSVGRRFFDVSIQGKKVLRDFNIETEAKGTGQAFNKSFTANVSENTLEIHFQWAGKGTTSVPHKNVYGPLVSAISVTPNFTPIIYDSLSNKKEKKLSTGAILGIVAAGCVLIVLISIFIWFFLRRKYAANNELKGLELLTGYFTLRQLKAATRNFNPANKIGEGGFGAVYKGVLPDGSVIAVKQLSSKSRQGNREFINEIGMISALQHPNLVKLFGCCVEGNQLLLIYEYMENNSLANALFGPERDRLTLDWQTRRRVCLGLAQGLAYLHEESRLKIVHRDIKATNVLLDKDLNAKISDFGLARLVEENESHISTRIAGTIGYMAPEYAMRGYLTDKADVYSFGVVTLEIVSGMNNTSYRQKEEFVYLLDWAYVLQEQGRLLELVDESLGANYSEEEALQMLNLALTCTNPAPSLRPTMSTVVSILSGHNPELLSSVKRIASNSDDTSLKAFNKLSNYSQSSGVSIDGPWIDSSVSVQSYQEENSGQSSTSKNPSNYFSA
ncbi:hypothetical protein J5N97_004738 [Dioscorea zingiberensis]|uniref:non-specific serine/threonine protein kinase n=1 Tax=Dioscorea zingiberensis TaxID=325984 RepID=A0A9D5D901_9LILI|nr:hypothetical protein J5N97_004738 [Dioscorea zingiberensis]